MPLDGPSTPNCQGRVLAAGYAQVDVWPAVYRADGLVGAVTMVGPDATEASVKKLATQAYRYAAQTLA